MNIAYRGLQMQIVHTRSMLREAVRSDDDTTLICQRWTIDVDCVYNPQATSFGAAGNVVGTTGRQAFGNFPPVTDAAIRQTLLQPQGLLAIADEDGRAILLSPAVGFTVDVKMGPIPEECQVQRIHGTKTWQVHFRIVTHINECAPGSPRKRAVLLSHRWKRYADHDEDYFSTVVTAGTCVFRGDDLVLLEQDPDQFRQQLFHAIPANFKRWHIKVMPSDDGTSVDYIVIDKEMVLNFNDKDVPNATRIEASLAGGYSQPNRMAEASRAVMGALNVDIGLSSITRMLGVGLQFAANILPSYFIHVVCRVWGNRNSLRKQMVDTALGVCLAKVGNSVGLFGRSDEYLIFADLTGKYVEVQMTIRWGPEQLAAQASALLLNAVRPIIGQAGRDITRIFGGLGDTNPLGLQGVMAFFASGSDGTDDNLYKAPHDTAQAPDVPAQDDHIFVEAPALAAVPEIKLTPVAVKASAVSTYPPPNSGGTRGTWVGRLVAQALSAPCAQPPRPPIRDAGGKKTSLTPGVRNIDEPTIDRPVYTEVL